MVGIYEKEYKRFVKAAHWLKESDMLMVLHLKTLARSLDAQLNDDGVIQAALAGQFRLVLSELKEPKKVESEDTEDDGLHFS